MKRPGPVTVLLALLVLCVGLGGSWQLYSSMQTAESLRERERLQTASRSVRDAFESDLARTVQAVEGAALFATLQDRLTALAWRNYGSSLLQRAVQVSTLEWTPLVRAAQREEVVHAGRSFSLPVLYAEPANPAAVGVDRALSPLRREASQMARDNGTTVASAAFTEACSPPQAALEVEVDAPRPAAGPQRARFSGADLCIAITAASYVDHEPASLLDRRTQNKGYVSAIVRYRDLLNEAVRRADAENLDLWLYDLTGEPTLLLAWTGAGGASAELVQARNWHGDAPPTTTAFVVLAAERSWELVFRPRTDFFRHVEESGSRLAAGLGIVVTLLLLAAVLGANHVFHVTAAARATAEAAARSKSEFLAHMSHEIRTPISAILGLSGLALKAGRSPKLHDYLRGISQSSEHLLSLLNDILDLSRIESGKLTIEAVPFEVRTVADNVRNLLSDRTEAKGLAMRFHVDSQLPETLIGDPLRIGQVLINLANNAVKFTEQGEIQLSIRVQQPIASDLLVYFEVRDTGIGLSGDQIDRLFHSFAQADGSITRHYGGSGLGLAICKSLVRAMGGEIGVHSVPGEGSVFWFTARLGIAVGLDWDAADRPAPAAPETRLGAIAGAHILLVEDHPINRWVVREMLQQAGFFVDVADNGEMAVQQVLAHGTAALPWDLVLMDLQMPAMDGVTATRLIRASHGADALPILAITASALPEDRARCEQAGMNGFLTKPVKPHALWAALLQFIRPRAGLGPAQAGRAPVPAPDAAEHRIRELLASVEPRLAALWSAHASACRPEWPEPGAGQSTTSQ